MNLKIINSKFKIFTEELFIGLTVSLVVFSVMELIKPRIALAYINLSWFILAWLVIGLTLLLIPKKDF